MEDRDRGILEVAGQLEYSVAVNNRPCPKEVGRQD